DAKIQVAVRVEFANEEASPDLKKSGALNVVRHELELLSASDKIPDNITIDVTGLEVRDAHHISHVSLPPGAESTLTDRDFTIATVVAPSALKQAERAESEEGETAEAEETGGEERASTSPDARSGGRA